jgi:hypothetical protein
MGRGVRGGLGPIWGGTKIANRNRIVGSVLTNIQKKVKDSRQQRTDGKQGDRPNRRLMGKTAETNTLKGAPLAIYLALRDPNLAGCTTSSC